MVDHTIEPSPSPQKLSPWMALLGTAILFALELLTLGTVFKHGIAFNCLENWSPQACGGASGALIAVYCVAGAMLLYGMLRPAPLRRLVAEAGSQYWPLVLNFAGLGIAMLPVLWLVDGAGTSVLMISFAAWISGMALLILGMALFVAPMPRWMQFFRTEWTTVLPILIAGCLTPYLATVIRPLWRLDTIADMTFAAVVWATELLGYEVLTEGRVIGTYDFAIDVAPVCSGIEGIALVTVFVTIYLSLFRKELRFPHAFLLYPLGILASATFNIVRITALLALGLEGHGELAIGGFHSHAGWMMFTLVALGIVVLAQSVPALKRERPAGVAAEPAPALPFWRDPTMAAILPFAVFMLTAIPVAAFSETPGAIYPLRVVIVGAVLLGFAAIYRALPWRADPIAIASGAVIAAMWIFIPVEPSEGGAPYGALTGLALVGWFIMRGLGTIVLVPLLEEVFFRQYLHQKIAGIGTGRAWTFVAVFVTAVLFAALHGRWAEAFVAALIFSWVAYRKGGNITDAIVSHAVANGLIFGVAVATGRLEMI